MVEVLVLELQVVQFGEEARRSVVQVPGSDEHVVTHHVLNRNTFRNEIWADQSFLQNGCLLGAEEQEVECWQNSEVENKHGDCAHEGSCVELESFSSLLVDLDFLKLFLNADKSEDHDIILVDLLVLLFLLDLDAFDRNVLVVLVEDLLALVVDVIEALALGGGKTGWVEVSKSLVDVGLDLFNCCLQGLFVIWSQGTLLFDCSLSEFDQQLELGDSITEVAYLEELVGYPVTEQASNYNSGDYDY